MPDPTIPRPIRKLAHWIGGHLMLAVTAVIAPHHRQNLAYRRYDE